MGEHRQNRCHSLPTAVSPIRHMVYGQTRSLISPADSDQELNDLEVATVLSKDPRCDAKYMSPCKSRALGAASKSVLSPIRPSTVITNLQRGNVQTTTPSILSSLTIHQMAAQGEIIMLQQEFEASGADVNKVDDQGFTALIWACANGQLTTVEYLLSKGGSLRHTGIHGENALLLASCYGHMDIVNQLLQLGMAVNYTDETGSSALMYAAYNNQCGCVKVLLEFGADITMENEEGHSALDLAVGRGHKAVQQVIEQHMLSLFGGPS